MRIENKTYINIFCQADAGAMVFKALMDHFPQTEIMAIVSIWHRPGKQTVYDDRLLIPVDGNELDFSLKDLKRFLEETFPKQIESVEMFDVTPDEEIIPYDI